MRQFQRFPVTSLYSVAHLFPPSKGRCGVYVLSFQNGERYVGQSVNVVRRFAEHRRTWDDVEFLDYVAVRAEDLHSVEQDEIRAQEELGRQLRNTTYATGPTGECDLDDHIESSQQHAWLAMETDVGGDAPVRSDDPKQRAAGRTAFQRLSKSGLLDVTAFVMGTYINASVPHPRETERTFWALSAMPTTNRDRDHHRLAALSVNKMETCVLMEGRFEDEWLLLGFVVVSRKVLAKRTDLKKIGKGDSLLSLHDSHYESAGPDQCRIGFVSFDGFQELRALPGFEPASRALVLRLMRKGPTFQWRWHNYPLADEVFRLIDEAASAR